MISPHELPVNDEALI